MTVVGKLQYVIFTRLLLAVLAQQNFPPDDIRLRFSYTAPEDTRVGAVLFNFTARYSNGHGDVSVTISNNYFAVKKVSGSDGVWNVILNTTLDREAADHHQLIFEVHGDVSKATDYVGINDLYSIELRALGTTKDCFIIVDTLFVILDVHTTLYVTDVNDNPPKFERLFYTADVNESTAVNTTVFSSIRTSDPDTGKGGIATYSLTYVGSGSQDIFAINSTSGLVQLTGPLDFEKTNFYHYIIRAIDGGGLNSTADLIFTVLDVQDTPPFFTGLPYTISVDEDATAHDSIFTVEAEDGDRFPGVSNHIRYNISEGLCVGMFEINDTTGILSVAKALDRDLQPLIDLLGECKVIVKATEVDTHPPQLGNTTATTTVTITVRDVNDNPPTFSNTSYTATIKENSPPGVSLVLTSNGQIWVSDNDQSSEDNSLLTISLAQSGDTFDLEDTHIKSQGWVSIRVKNTNLLDYETSQTLGFTIWATDNPVIKGKTLSASATVTVSIEPVNEFAPEFSQTDISASVAEGSPVGQTVVQVQAFDRDIGGSHGTITYSLQNYLSIFQIDRDSGVVKVASNTTDRETMDTYVLLVHAQDGGGLLNTTSLTITVEDVNDNPPVFLRKQYEATLRENKVSFTRPLRVEATDEDKPGTENSNVTYNLTGFEDYFEVDPNTGDIKIKQRLNYEQLFPFDQTGVINLTVVAQDQGQSPLSATAHVIITLLDENEFPPEFKDANSTADVSEDSTAGTPVKVVKAADKDTHHQISYFIVSGDLDRFSINPATGEITVSGSLDREDRPIYILKIGATDQVDNPKTGHATVFVNIRDVNDEMPSFGEHRDVTIDVNEATSGHLYSMTAADPDLNNQLQYSILWDETFGQSGVYENLTINDMKDWIKIDETSGEVMALKPLNKTAIRKVSLTVLVEDTAAYKPTPQRARGSLTMNIIDINNNSPRFIPGGRVWVNVTENSGEGTAIIFDPVVQVADLDEGRNSEFQLKLEGKYADYFEVYPVTVLLSADVIIRVKNSTVLDYETLQSLDLNVTAKETLTQERLGDTLMVHVEIQDENDFSPRFTNQSYDVKIPENTTQGTTIYTLVQANDGDRSPEFNTVVYSLPDSNGLFSINSSSGYVSVTHDNGFDYEKIKSYSLTVEATDGGGRRDMATLNVNLTDVNDNQPVFEKPEYLAFVTENEKSFDSPITIKATDSDDGVNKEIEYFILDTSPLHQNFTVNSTTGELSLVTPLDYESLPDKSTDVVVLVIEARDHGVPPLTSTVNVTITVKDVNDNTPQFDTDTYRLIVPENVEKGTQVLVVHAGDKDGSAPNNKVFYSIEEGDHDRFQVGHTSGNVTVVGKLDRESVATYTLKIMASDEGANPLPTYCYVHINVSDVNDEPPRFRENHAMTDSSNGVFGKIYNMSAVDLDLHSVLKYYILWNESYGLSSSLDRILGENLKDWLDIDSEYGWIYEKRAFDSTKVRKFVLTLMVQDLNASDPSLQEDTAILTITVTGSTKVRRSAEMKNISETAHISKQGERAWDADVTFSAGLTHYQEVTEAQRIVYDIVFVNDDNGYSSSTGTFTCPQSGEYVFEVHTFAPRNSSVCLSLYHKVTRVRTLEVHAEKDSRVESVTAVLQLLQGDEVYVMSTPDHSSRLFGAPDTILNTFSGYLLSPASQ